MYNQMRIIKKMLIVLLLWGLTLHLNANDIFKGVVDKILGDNNISFDIPGLKNGKLQCFDYKGDWKSPKNWCDDVDKGFENILGKVNNGLNGSIDFGPCKFTSDNELNCSKSRKISMCNDLFNSSNKTTFSPVDSMLSQIEYQSIVGGDAYFNDLNPCGEDKNIFESIKIGKKSVESVYNEVLTYENLTEKANGDLYDGNKIKLYEDCYKAAIATNKDPEQACRVDSLNLPEDRITVKKEIDKATKIIAKDPLDNFVEKNMQLESNLEYEKSNNCDNVENVEECENNVLKNLKIKEGDSLVDINQYHMNRKKEVEEKYQLFYSQMDLATQPEFKINFPTQNALNKVDTKYKEKYIALSRKQIAQDALVNSFMKEISSLEKELIDINKVAIESSKPFYRKAALEKAKEIMSSGLAND